MGPPTARGEAIRHFILRNVQANPRTISRLAGEEFSIGRQGIGRHLRRLVEEGALLQSGRTNNRVYRLAVQEWIGTYPIAGSSDEDVVWRNDVAATLGDLPDNVRNIWHHGFTEMFNNAVDHSAGSRVIVAVKATAVMAEMQIQDDGVGIFRKIQRERGLLDEHHAIFELSKGKLTTDPERHTGEGIFFTSRMFDAFEILSGAVFFSHEIGAEEDWLLERPKSLAGTAVFMRLDNETSRTTREIYDQFTGDDGDVPVFSKTVVPVRLAQYGDDRLISRSQAKRVLARVDRFSTVLLDFRDVPTIGQAFADEVFRVFRREHPDVSIIPINPNPEVRRMIGRTQSALET